MWQVMKTSQLEKGQTLLSQTPLVQNTQVFSLCNNATVPVFKTEQCFFADESLQYVQTSVDQIKHRLLDLNAMSSRSLLLNVATVRCAGIRLQNLLSGESEIKMVLTNGIILRQTGSE